MQNQSFNMPVYLKDAEVDQYIFLLPIMQSAKNPNSKLYYANASFETKECTLNQDSGYQESGLYNVIIDKDKTEEDEISVTLNGGIADGTVINLCLTTDANSGIDSLLFNDANLCEAVYLEISKLIEDEEDRYLKYGGNILNVNHEVISRVEKLDLSNKNISDLTGLESFDCLRDLNISNNSGIQTLNPIKYCKAIESLNASSTSVKNNISAIESFDNLKTLMLNNVGMTKIDSINNWTNSKLANEQELTLLELDISANLLNNINGVEKISSLKKLSATSNQLTDVPNLSSLTRLERLTMYANKLTKAPVIGQMDSLKYIFLSDNKITDISEMNKLTSVIELDLSNNLLEDSDIEQIKNMRVTKKLKIAGNNIEDISNLRTSISSVTELDISKNMIKDVSVVDNRLSENSTLIANNQKIAMVLNRNEQNAISIDLPQIFIAAKTTGSYFYTADDFETTNCTVSGSKLNINLDELGDDVATVKIVGGKAKDTVLSIVVSYIDTQINYSSNDWTNQSVTATITFTNRNNVSILNNGGNNQYTFDENGEFTFEYVDEFGMKGSTKVVVTWIDKESPKVTGVENSRTYTSTVRPVITDNHELVSVTLSKDGETEQPFVSEREISEPGQYCLIARDSVNNETRVVFTIKEEGAPEETLTSNTYTINNESKIISNISVSTNLAQLKDLIESNSEYTVKDSKGNIVDENGVIGTGYTINTSLGDYKLAVKGDIDGDGQSNIRDILAANKHRLNKTNLQGEYFIAGDVVEDGKVDIKDILQINKYRLGKINSL